MGTIKRECRVCNSLSDIEIGEWDWTTELTWICPDCQKVLDYARMADDIDGRDWCHKCGDWVYPGECPCS